MAITGFPDFSTSAGLKVIRGRLPGAIQLGCPGQVLRLINRLPWMMPVFPSRTGRAAQSTGRSGHHVSPAVHHGKRSGSPLGWERSHSFLDRFHLIGIAGTKFEGSLMRINQWPPDFRVRLRKQLFHRYFHKSRIGIVLISIRHGQLHNFGNGMDVVRREQSHFLEVKSLQQAEPFQQERALCPGAALQYLEDPVFVDCRGYLGASWVFSFQQVPRNAYSG
jgi:hypothetical protein